MRQLVCLRVADMGSIPVPEGAEVRRCMDCDEPISISPASLRALDIEEMHLRCMVCAIPHIAEAEELKVVLMPGQLEEIFKRLTSKDSNTKKHFTEVED